MTSSRTRSFVLCMSLLQLFHPFCRSMLKRSITRSLHSKWTFRCNFSPGTLAEHNSSRMAQQNPPMLVVIAGPTACGKSDVAAKICAHQKGMIVSADSVQAYRGVQIGANKPTDQERKETPHILIDVANHEETYNAADWRDDAIFCIRNLLLEGEDEDTPDSTTPQTLKRRKEILDAIEKFRGAKGWGKDLPVLPVICGGTMMYIQWLVHGRPDASRPTPTAVKESYKIIEHFQKEKNYQGAADTVSSFGTVFADRIQQFCGDDWYRLRRTLEIALTMKEQATAVDDNQDSNDPAEDNSRQKRIETMVENLYSGQRQGSLATLGYDVRCFFLCPDDRMSHTRVVDERCEQMIIRGLIKETTDLKLSGRLPEMAERAIGYRQTLDYLLRESHADETEEIIFDSFVNDFTTATRRYAKKQMAWFRKDKKFMFVLVPLKLDTSDRVDTVADEIEKYCQLSRAEYEKVLFDAESKHSSYKKENELQGKSMKFYQFHRHILKPESEAYVDSLSEAVECRERMRVSGTRKRGIEETFLH